MKIFISGGCKNGKSYYAQRLAMAQKADRLYYIATMRSADSEDDERIARHREERAGWGFETIEQPVDIEKILQKGDARGSFLLDSTTALLANEMFHSDGSIHEDAAGKICDGLKTLADNVSDLVIVSDYIYSDAMIYDPFTEKYRKSLAEIDCAAARMCDAVLEVSYSSIVVHKGREGFDALYQTIR